MAASRAPAHANNKRRRIIGVLLGIVIISGIVSLMMRTGEKKEQKEKLDMREVNGVTFLVVRYDVKRLNPAHSNAAESSDATFLL